MHTTTLPVTAYPAIGSVRGPAAAPYVKGGKYYVPGRAPVTLRGSLYGIQVVKPLAGGRIAVVSRLGLTFHSDSGTLVKRISWVRSIATNDAGTRVAYATPGGRLGVASRYGTVIRWRDRFRKAFPVGFRGGDVFVSWACDTYAWTWRDNRLHRWSIHPATTVSESTGRIVLITEVTDDYRICYQMADMRGRVPKPIYNRCGTFYPMQLSAGPARARYLIGAHALDGYAPGLWQVARSSDGRGVAVNLIGAGAKNAILKVTWSGSFTTTTWPLDASSAVRNGTLPPYLLVSH